MTGPSFQEDPIVERGSPLLDSDRDPVEVLAAEFVDRFRRGERPTIEDYAQEYPECAAQIRELFPTIAAMEQLKVRKESHSGGQPQLGHVQLKRLGDFRILGEIGRGGMGIVYEAEQESLGRHVAVKVLPQQSLLEERRLKRFEREARTAAKLHHTNIVPILGVGEDDGYHYYVMQFIRGVGLDEVIAHLRHITLSKASDSSAGASVAPGSDRAVDISTLAGGLLRGQWREPTRSGSASKVSTDASTDRHASSNLPPREVVAARQQLDKTASHISSLQHVKSSPESEPEEPSESATVGWQSVPADGRFGMAYWQSVARIGLQVAGALQYAHTQGTLHRDIKPANLLLDARAVVWITDFGLAKAIEQDNLSRTGDIVGTLRYMAPEQVDGETTARSDIFSLGLTLYELLTLQPAYNDSERRRSLLRQDSLSDPVEPRKLNSSIPRDLETIVMKACAVEPSRRYRSAGDLADDLERFLEDRPIDARRVSPAERIWRWCRRNPAVAFWAGTAAALLLLVFGLLSFGFVQAKRGQAIVATALDGEKHQRRKAEETLAISLEALDKVYQRFAPDRLGVTEELTVGDSIGDEAIEVPTQLAISGETAEFLEDILAVYDRFAEQDSDNLALRQEAAKANRRVGDIHQRLGQYAQAEAAYQRSIEEYEAILQRSPDSSHLRAELARVHNEMGILHRLNRNSDRARQCHSTSLETLTSSGQLDEFSSPELRYELARTYYLLGRSRQFGGFRARGRPDGPERGRSGGGGRSDSGRSRGGPPGAESAGLSTQYYFSMAIDLLQELRRQLPQDPGYRHLLALCYRDRTDRRQEGHLADLNQSVQDLEELCRDFPAIADYRNDLSEAYRRQGYYHERLVPLSPEELVLWNPVEIADAKQLLVVARQQLEKALDNSAIVVDQHQGVPQYIRNQSWVNQTLGRICHKLAVIYGLSGQFQQQAESFEQAESHYQEGIRLSTILVRDSSDAVFDVWQLRAREQLAAVLYERGKFDAAQQALDEIIDDFHGLLSTGSVGQDRSGGTRFAREILSGSYRTLARVLAAKGEFTAAQEVTEKAEQWRSSGPGESGNSSGGRGSSDGRRRRPPLEGGSS